MSRAEATAPANTTKRRRRRRYASAPMPNPRASSGGHKTKNCSSTASEDPTTTNAAGNRLLALEPESFKSTRPFTPHSARSTEAMRKPLTTKKTSTSRKPPGIQGSPA